MDTIQGEFAYNEFFIEVEMTYNVVLVSTVQKIDSYIYIYIYVHIYSFKDSFTLEVITKY